MSKTKIVWFVSAYLRPGTQGCKIPTRQRVESSNRQSWPRGMQRARKENYSTEPCTMARNENEIVTFSAGQKLHDKNLNTVVLGQIYR